MHQQTR